MKMEQYLWQKTGAMELQPLPMAMNCVKMQIFRCNGTEICNGKETNCTRFIAKGRDSNSLRPLLPTHFPKIGWYRRLPFRGLVDMRAVTFYAILLVEASALAVPRLTVLQ